jgi:hypothetical protein
VAKLIHFPKFETIDQRRAAQIFRYIDRSE